MHNSCVPASNDVIIGYFQLVTFVHPCGIPAIAPKKMFPKEMRNRIAYGWAARRNSLPWMAVILIREEQDTSCAGFLVDNGSGYQSDIVVTATHCVSSRTKNFPPSKVHVILGAHELKDVEPAMVYRPVKSYATHFYNYDNDDNDITLLKLASPVNYTKEVSPICLPTKHTTNREVNSCFAAGWGKTENGSLSKILKQTRVRVVPISECYHHERGDRALCVREYYTRSMPCVGDSGSPLFCEIDGRYFALGVLSLGPRNCSLEEDATAFYVRMDNYHEWTLNTMKLLETARDQSDDDVGEVKSVALLPSHSLFCYSMLLDVSSTDVFQEFHTTEQHEESVKENADNGGRHSERRLSMVCQRTVFAILLTTTVSVAVFKVLICFSPADPILWSVVLVTERCNTNASHAYLMELFPGLKERQRTFRSSTYITYFLVTLVRPCGIPAIAPKKTPAKEMHNRIAYGWQARRNSLPWMVFIIILKEGEVNCNGFLVDNGSGYQSDIVVTAAHCVSSRTQNIAPSKMHVVLGAHELRDVEPTMVYRQVKNYATHFYNYDDDDNDITLLKLTSPVNYTKEISPLCLPTKHTTNRVVNSCFAAGWGRTENGSTSLLLKQTRVRIAPLSQCYFAERAGRALCVREYYNQSIPCIGDSGSPLFCEIDGRYFALGILSLGPTNCSQQEDPSALYVRMDNYHEWTLNTMKQLETAQNRTDDDVGELAVLVRSCGIPAIAPRKKLPKKTANRIAYGWEARRNSLPWMAYILIVEEEEMGCAGFLVDNGSGNQSDIVVTATHCIASRTKNLAPSKLHVILGAHEVRDIEPTMVYRRVRNYATHFYNYDNDDNDITLLKLTSPVNYTREVSPICLPTKHTTNREVNSCFAAGWGRTENASSSVILKQTRLRVAPISECFYEERDERALCVREYYNRSMPCTGDSGGPLFCEIDGRYFALGIMSLGPKNCSEEEEPPAFYVRMDNYHNWTLNAMKLLETAPDRSGDVVDEVKVRVDSRLTLPGLLSLVPKRDKSKSLTGLELIALLSGYHKRPSNY
ncbi:hypothetical protein M514_02561 [Trichuris suis]|uniref:Peptidase S1 domain-containing protein n=1 Tax=Trichuris suis TaxID=68888 RepID=A0A085NNE0_9BILA|nr:hypothetical protein M514_02561 [Trichuris suis]